MHEDETIGEFNARLCDIANETFMLGEKISEEKLVRKTLRSLPKRFAYKVTTIEEAKDMTAMKLEELMGSLRTFEMNLEEERGEKKVKGIALKTEAERDDVKSCYDDDEELIESVAMLSTNVGRIMKRVSRRSNEGAPQRVPGATQNTRNFNTPKKNKPPESNPDSRNRRSNIQCRECEVLAISNPNVPTH